MIKIHIKHLFKIKKLNSRFKKKYDWTAFPNTLYSRVLTDKRCNLFGTVYYFVSYTNLQRLMILVLKRQVGCNSFIGRSEKLVRIMFICGFVFKFNLETFVI